MTEEFYKSHKPAFFTGRRVKLLSGSYKDDFCRVANGKIGRILQKRLGFSISFPACPKCGHEPYITKVKFSDVELLEDKP